MADLPPDTLSLRQAVAAVAGTGRDVLARLRQLNVADLRWSWILIAGLAVVGGIINVTCANGWTIWPLIAVIGLLLMVNEATDRNAVGIPPLQVYALFFSFLTLYAGALAILTLFNGLVLLAGMVLFVWYAIRAHLAERRRELLLCERELNGLCIHCGHPIDRGFAFCRQCGQEPNPSEAQRRRIQILMEKGPTGHAREILTRRRMTYDVSKKEQALLAKQFARRSKLR